ncbi:NAD-binding protein [Pseudonocardia humida]|uniref:NAD-binding protein n=1 Tax=Pseudonocardia humida TaxID=2800819 RepID=A0ABT1A6K3_9PSEU|nr:NAD-binding protein [Pseudonocardia humida]MCO1658647.1 NAD-binding protein [Pseudonocardia humida]
MAHGPGAGRRRAALWVALTGAVYATGVSGYLNLRQLTDDPRTLSWPEALYRGARLFTLNVDLPEGTQAPWWLWVAALLAPLLLARGVLVLFRDRIGGALVRFAARPALVVFGAGERAAALVAASTAGADTGPAWRRAWRRRWWRRDVVVVVDPDPQALESIDGPLVHTVVGDGTGPGSLRAAAVARAAEVAVITGDTVRNSAVAAALLGLGPPVRDIHVEVDDPGLAGTLEQGGVRTGVAVNTFNAATLTATDVLDELDLVPDRPPARAGEPGEAVLLFGTGPLVDAFVLELYRRQRVRLLDAPWAPPPRIAVFGPDSAVRCAGLARLLGSELQLLELEPFEVQLAQAVELDPDTTRHLHRYRPVRQVVVAVPTDLAGGGIALTLARHFGPPVPVALVTESASNPFGEEIARQARQRRDTLSSLRLHPAPERAYTLPALRANRDVARLGRALFEAEPRGPVPARSSVATWNALDEADRRSWTGKAEELLERTASRGAPLRRSALVPVDSPELALLHALGVERPAALVRAGLRIDFTDPTALRAAADALGESDRAFEVWCEVARLRTDAALLGRDHRAVDPTDDVDRLVLLRRAVLGDTDARRALPPAGGLDVGDRPVVLLGDPDQLDEQAHHLLTTALDQRLDPPRVFATGTAQDAAGFGTGVAAVAGDDHRRGRTRLLDLLGAAVRARHAAASVRVLVLPGAATDEVLLARAIGATVGWVQLPGGPDLARTLLNGAVGVVPLPVDRTTVRAFLHPGRWPGPADERDGIAEELHRRYTARRRDRRAINDPSMRPWSKLSPWLRESNRAVVDDITTKLAAVGLRIDPGAPGPLPTGWPSTVTADQREFLAEMEHGRYTAERLQSGWTLAARAPARFASPWLVPWSELDEDEKDYDRFTVSVLPEVLAACGIGLRTL